MKTVRQSMLNFQSDYGRFPTSEELGLPIFATYLDLEVERDASGYPVDAWGHRYQFNPAMGVAFGFLSVGPDGKTGTPESKRDDWR